MQKSKTIWILLGSIFLVGTLVAGIFLVFQNQNIAEKASPSTSLAISPGSQNKSPGDSFSVKVEMTTGDNQSIGFDLAINFDPQVFSVSSISPGTANSGFTEIRNTIDNTAGKISYSVYTTDVSKAITGSGVTILNISGTVKSNAPAGSHNFSFDASTAISGLSENQNVLTGTTPGSIVVASLNSNIQPTATPSSTGTPSPSLTAQPTPTVQPSPTKTPATAATQVPTQSAQSTPRPIPVTGVDWPTTLSIGVGVGVIIMSVIIAL